VKGWGSFPCVCLYGCIPPAWRCRAAAVCSCCQLLLWVQQSGRAVHSWAVLVLLACDAQLAKSEPLQDTCRSDDATWSAGKELLCAEALCTHACTHAHPVPACLCLLHTCTHSIPAAACALHACIAPTRMQRGKHTRTHCRCCCAGMQHLPACVPGMWRTPTPPPAAAAATARLFACCCCFAVVVVELLCPLGGVWSQIGCCQVRQQPRAMIIPKQAIHTLLRHME
jgi:hypothetical protein